MDTRAPPIAPRTQDRSQQQQQHHHHHHQQAHSARFKQEEVTLPPLTSFPAQRQKNKYASAPTWRNGGVAPGLLKQHETQRRRPYKVLGIGATPLMHACQQADRARVLKLLREQEETIGYRDRARRSALHYCMDAATGGAVAQAAPELVNSPDAEGHTPLHLAVIAGDHQLVAVLLANGADVNAKDLEGHSVLHWATVCGEVECVRLVLAAGARPSTADLRGGSPLHYAAQCCGAAATAELAVPKKVGLKVLQTLLEFGADVNARDEDGRQPILWAASAGSVEAILALVRAGGSAVAGASDKDGLTALHCAASRGHARCIEALVNLCDAQPDHVDDNGCSALHYAATLGHADATALLLKLGADPNRQDRKGRTPALCAAAKGQLETLKILAQHGGSLHARTVRGTGVGHEAVASGRVDLVRWLARRRPSLLDVATQDGKTPLHVAALHGHLDVCKLLLDGGARVNALLRTSKGALMTALDAALYRGHRDCAKLIQLHGGTTAQQLRSHKGPTPKVFSTKLRLRHTETSSDSELNDASPRHRHHRHRSRDPDLYYEERWTERRTRRRANRRRLSRQDSRSFSEEELRHSKSSSRATERQRRALSENARYEEELDGPSEPDHDEEDVLNEKGRRRRRKSERHSRRKGEDEEEGAVSASESGGRTGSSKSDEESASVSDDSLEVVVVKRSVEKTSEKIVSGRKSKTPREHKDAKAAAKKTPRKEKEQDRSKREKRDRPEKRKSSSQEQQRPFDKDPDSTSQETVEQVTVTADVHENGAPDSSRDAPGDAAEQEADEQMRSKVEDILEKADELQNALLTKAADLRKDMEEMRQQVSQKSEEGEKNDEEKEEKDTVEEKSEREKSEKELKEDEKSEKEKSEKESSEKEKSEEDKLQDTSKSEEQKTLASETTSMESSSSKGESPTEKTPRVEKRASVDEKAASDAKNDEKQPEEKSKDEKTPEETETDKSQGKVDDSAKEVVDETRQGSESQEVAETKRGSIAKEKDTSETKQELEVKDGASKEDKKKDETDKTQEQAPRAQNESQIPGTEGFRFADESSSSSPGGKGLRRGSRPSTGKRRGRNKAHLFESSEECSPDRSAIVAVIESPEWDEEDDEEIDKEIRRAVGEAGEHEEDEEEDEEDDREDDSDGVGIVRVLPSTSEEEMGARTSAVDSLPQLQTKSHARLARLSSPKHHHHSDLIGGRFRQRRDSGGRDSGIEPSPRVSRIPRRTSKCYPNTERQQALHMDTITRDVQVSLRRYHLERKIFFQLMELKRLQIRHGRANEQVLVKRQVEAFHKAGMSGPALGVARYDQPYTFRHFESFLYEQLRRLQRRPTTPDWCTEAKQCTQKTHRCHHATSAYTSVPIYTYLGGGAPERPSLLPRIEGRGRGQMTVEVTHGDEKQVIALPSEKLDRTKRYYVTFTVRGETTDSDKPKTPSIPSSQRHTKSV